MSKSLGNSPDPLDLFDKYGVDAVRVSILLLAPQGTDVLFSEDKIDLGRNFMNKLWNCSRFLMMNIDHKESIISFDKLDNSDFELVDNWILSRLSRTIKETNDLMDNYLDTANIPDPDLIIRTSGEMRLSNFLLWQCAYSEFIFTDTFWPDFTVDHFYDALEQYSQRERRYGRNTPNERV